MTLDWLIEHLSQIVTVVTGLIAVWGWIAKPIRRVSKQLADLDRDVGDILCTQLVGEHDQKMAQGWCSSADKERIAAIYHEYKARGRNHLAERFLEDVIALPPGLPAGGRASPAAHEAK